MQSHDMDTRHLIGHTNPDTKAQADHNHHPLLSSLLQSHLVLHQHAIYGAQAYPFS